MRSSGGRLRSLGLKASLWVFFVAAFFLMMLFRDTGASSNSSTTTVGRSPSQKGWTQVREPPRQRGRKQFILHGVKRIRTRHQQKYDITVSMLAASTHNRTDVRRCNALALRSGGKSGSTAIAESVLGTNKLKTAGIHQNSAQYRDAVLPLVQQILFGLSRLHCGQDVVVGRIRPQPTTDHPFFFAEGELDLLWSKAQQLEGCKPHLGSMGHSKVQRGHSGTSTRLRSFFDEDWYKYGNGTCVEWGPLGSPSPVNGILLIPPAVAIQAVLWGVEEAFTASEHVPTQDTWRSMMELLESIETETDMAKLWEDVDTASVLCNCGRQPATVLVPVQYSPKAKGSSSLLLSRLLSKCGYKKWALSSADSSGVALWVSERYDPAALVGDSATESGQVARVPPPVCSAVYYCMATTAFLLWRLDGKHIPGHYIEEKLATSFYRGPTGVGSTGVCPTHAGGGADERLLMIDIGVNNGEQIPTWFELFNHCGRATDYVLIEALPTLQDMIITTAHRTGAKLNPNVTVDRKNHQVKLYDGSVAYIVSGAVVDESLHNTSVVISGDTKGAKVAVGNSSPPHTPRDATFRARAIGLGSLLGELELKLTGNGHRRRVALLKVDCEGLDAVILQSIESTLLREQLVELIVFERNAGTDAEAGVTGTVYPEAVDMLLRHGYRVFIVALSPWSGAEELYLVEILNRQHFEQFSSRLEELVAFPAGLFGEVLGNPLPPSVINSFGVRMMPKRGDGIPFDSCDSYGPILAACLPKMYRIWCPRCGLQFERYSRRVSIQQVPHWNAKKLFQYHRDGVGRCSRPHVPKRHVPRKTSPGQ